MQGHNSSATINDWSTLKMGDNTYLIGRVNHHSQQSDFKAPLQITSQVNFLDRESGLAQTENTLYRLGDETIRSKSNLSRLRYQMNV